MRLGELVESSAYIRSLHGKSTYSVEQALQKEFGNIYYNDKVVYYNEQCNIIELRMTMSTKTEKAYSGVHAIRMAIYAPKGRVYNSMAELVADLRGQSGKKDYINDPNSTGAIRSKARNMNSHDLEGLQNGYRGREYTADVSTRTFADVGINTEEYDRAYNTDDAESEKYIMNNFKGIVLPCASASEKFSNNYLPDGRVFYLEEPINLNSVVRVSCSCSSYYWVCSFYNNARGAHLGPAPSPYTRRTKRSKPVLNVDKRPGLCKHLMLFTMMLINNGILIGLDSGIINNYKDVLKANEEHLVIPKRMANNTSELRKLYNKTERQTRELARERAYASGSVDSFTLWKKAMHKQNWAKMQAGDTSIRSVRQGVSLSNYAKYVLQQSYKSLAKQGRNAKSYDLKTSRPTGYRQYKPKYLD